MLEVKSVVQIAKKYIADVFSEDGGHKPLLEEVRHTDGYPPWEVVVSIAPAPEVFGSITGLGPAQNRRLKTVYIDHDGAVTDVQIYKP